jgi:hypothetical protein
MDQDIIYMLIGFFPIIFLAGVYIGHSLGVNEYRPEAPNGRTTENRN